MPPAPVIPRPQQFCNNFHGTRTVEEGAREAVRLALLDDNGPTGTYSNDDGPLPW